MRSLLLNRQGVVASTAAATTIVVDPTALPEAEWLMTCVASDGAIRETPGDVNVRPYMSCYAALGLVRAYEVAGHQPYLDAAKGWCVWYAAHMDATTGYVNDYHAASSSPAVDWVDSGAADSTDAYAGMFAVVLLKTWLATNGADPTWADTVNAAAPGGNALLLALTAITSTQQEDGLTWALPTYTVKYLEDNLETLAGLSALDVLASFTSNSAVSAAIAAPELGMARGLGTLWNYQARTWDYALHENNIFTPNDWSDENSRRQQIWALAWGADPPGLGDNTTLLAAYVDAFPDWSTRRDSYEVLPAWAMRRVGLTSEADAGVANLEASAAATSHAYPWTCATSGQLLIAKYDYGQFSYAYPTFPNGVNLMPNPDFALDSNSDGIADGVGNYGSPTMTLIPDSPSPSNIQQMASPGGMDMRWEPIAVTGGRFYVLSCYRKITSLAAGNQGVLKYELNDPSGTYLRYGYADLSLSSAVDSSFVRWFVVIWCADDVGQIRPVIGGGTGDPITIQVKEVKLEEAGCSPTPFIYPHHATVADHFEDADTLTTASGSITFDNTGFDAATEEGTIVGYDGWVILTPTKSCTVTLDTTGSGPGSPDTHVIVYKVLGQDWTLANLGQIAQDDDSGAAHGGPSATSWLQLTLQGGVIYYVQVGMHYTHTPTTAMKLNWSGLDLTEPADYYPPRHDALKAAGFTPGALDISGVGQDPPFSNYDYSSDSAEPGSHKYRSAWYHFVPTASGTVVLDTSLVFVTGTYIPPGGGALSSYTDTYIALYTGPAGADYGDLTLVGADDDSGGGSGQSRLSIGVTAGLHYYVQAAMYNSTGWNDNFALRWSIP